FSRYLFFYCYLYPRFLHSFPTRRSSDLVLDFAILHEDVAAFVDGKSRRKLVPVFRDERADAGVAASLFIGRRQEDYVAVQMCIGDRKSTRLNSSHLGISYAVFCLKKKIK